MQNQTPRDRTAILKTTRCHEHAVSQTPDSLLAHGLCSPSAEVKARGGIYFKRYGNDRGWQEAVHAFWVDSSRAAEMDCGSSIMAAGTRAHAATGAMYSSRLIESIFSPSESLRASMRRGWAHAPGFVCGKFWML